MNGHQVVCPNDMVFWMCWMLVGCRWYWLVVVHSLLNMMLMTCWVIPLNYWISCLMAFWLFNGSWKEGCLCLLNLKFYCFVSSIPYHWLRCSRSWMIPSVSTCCCWWNFVSHDMLEGACLSLHDFVAWQFKRDPEGKQHRKTESSTKISNIQTPNKTINNKNNTLIKW